MGCCVAVTSCGKTTTSTALPSGYLTKQVIAYYSMAKCRRHVQQDIRDRAVENMTEQQSDQDEYIVFGTLNSAAVLYVCRDQPYPNATFTFALKPKS